MGKAAEEPPPPFPPLLPPLLLPPPPPPQPPLSLSPHARSAGSANIHTVTATSTP